LKKFKLEYFNFI